MAEETDDQLLSESFEALPVEYGLEVIGYDPYDPSTTAYNQQSSLPQIEQQLQDPAPGFAPP